MQKRKAKKPTQGGFVWLTPAIQRVLLVLAGISALILLISFAVSSWVKLPEVPDNPDYTLPTIATPDPSKTEGVGDEGGDGTADGIRDRREGVYTFLVAGKDTAGGGNTDTMLLITYDTINQTIDAINLPRDTMVNVSYYSKRLNAVYNYSKGKDKATQVTLGTNGLKKEVSKLTGIYPDFYVVVSWEAVGEIVDAIGGVWFDVPFTMDYDDPTPGQDLHIHQEEGYRLLTGDDAMQVLRHRKNNDGSHAAQGDIGRIQVQQDFLKAMAAQCLKPEILLKAGDILNIFLEEVQTDLTIGNLLAFAQSASGMDADNDINMYTMPYADCYYYASYIVPVEEELLTIINAGLNPYDEDIVASDLELLYQNANGSMAVTNGELQDPSMAEKPYYPPATTEPVPDVTEPTPDVTEPATDVPEPTEPATDVPEPTEPVTDVPEPTEPAETQPAITQPAPDLPDPVG